MQMNLVVPVGSVRFVFYYKKKFKEIIIGEKKYCRIYVPSNIFFAFQNVSKQKSLVVNYSNIIHQKNKEVINLNLKELNYIWKK